MESRPKNRMEVVRRWIVEHESASFPLLAGVWVLVLYGRVLGAPFVYDDLDQIVNNPWFATWGTFARHFLLAPVQFTSSFRGAGGSTYRPLCWISLAADRKLWGLSARGYHFSNLVLHVLAGSLGFRLLRALRVGRLVAAAAVLIWLALPINSEVVAWVSGRAYALCTVFLLLSLGAGLRFFRRGGVGSLGVFGAAALAAVMSHEMGLLLLPLLALLLLLLGETTDAGQRRRARGLGFAGLAAGAVYFGVRMGLGAHGASGSPALASVGLLFWRYVGWIALPLHLSVERSTSTPADVVSGGSMVAWMGLLALVVAGVALRRRARGMAGGLLLLPVGLLPFCGLVFLYQGMAERFAYLASAGLVLAIVFAAARVPGRVRPIAIGLLGCWVMWSVWRLEERVSDWRYPVQLFRHSLEANPESASLTYNLAFSLRQAGDLRGAETEYQRTIALRRDFPHAFTSLGDVYLQTGRMVAAERAYEIALGQSPNDVATMLNLAVALQKDERPKEAEGEYRKVIALSPEESTAYSNLGVLLLQQGRAEEAEGLFQRAIACRATDPTPYFDLAVMYQQQGRKDLALPLYRRVLEMSPGDPDTVANMQAMAAAEKAGSAEGGR